MDDQRIYFEYSEHQKSTKYGKSEDCLEIFKNDKKMNEKG